MWPTFKIKKLKGLFHPAFLACVVSWLAFVRRHFHGNCLFDSEIEQRALQFLHRFCSDECSHSTVPESNKQNLRDRALDLSIFFRYKHMPSLKNLPSPAPNESLPYWFQGNFAASFVLSFCLREFLFVCIH